MISVLPTPACTNADFGKKNSEKNPSFSCSLLWKDDPEPATVDDSQPTDMPPLIPVKRKGSKRKEASKKIEDSEVQCRSVLIERERNQSSRASRSDLNFKQTSLHSEIIQKWSQMVLKTMEKHPILKTDRRLDSDTRSSVL